MFQLNWSILKNLSFEPLCNPLMTCYNIPYVLLWLEGHTHTFSQVSAQLEHFKNFDFRTPLWPLMIFYTIAYVLSWLECPRHTFSHVSAQLVSTPLQCERAQINAPAILQETWHVHACIHVYLFSPASHSHIKRLCSCRRSQRLA